MIKTHLQKAFVVLLYCSIFIISEFQTIHAQVLGPQQHKIKWMATNALYSWFSNMGADVEFTRRDRAQFINVDQIDGLCWPNEYHTRMKGIRCGNSLWIGASNFDDPVAKVAFPYKVVCVGPRSINTSTEIISAGITMTGKFKRPSVNVDYNEASYINDEDVVDTEDNMQTADRVVLNTIHTSIGVTVNRKILAFSQQYHNNYYIYEYTFKNTGIINESGVNKLNKTLTGVVFYMQHRNSFAGESYTASGQGGWAPATSTWGRNTIHDAVGQDANHLLPAPNNFRAIFSYYGPMSSTSYGSPAGDIGLPGPLPHSSRWTLAGTQFSGIVILHADKSPSDTSDDKSQPTTTKVAGADDVINSQSQTSQYNQSLMQRKYLEFMTAGNPPQTMADEIGKDANGWPTNYANMYGTDAGGYMGTQGFGPYTLAPGDSVRIVLAEAVAGISREKIHEVAKNWAENNTSEFYLPNGTLSTDKNVYKNSWVFSGKDSLFQTFRRAISNYQSNYNIPQPPPPPDKFEVTTFGKYNRLKWSNSAETWPAFNGYDLYRIEERTDTTYDLIFSCNAGNVVNEYVDATTKKDVKYYYYLQTKDDGSTNPGDPTLNIPAGEPLVSSRYYTMTGREAVSSNTLSRFQSHGSGNWNSTDSWEYLNNTAWVHPAPYVPTDTDGVVIIQSGHSINVSQPDSVNQLLVASGGTITIQSNGSLKIKGGDGTDLRIFGLLVNQGVITMYDTVTAVFEEGSKYIHARDGGTIPKAQWKKNAMCEITGAVNSAPLNTNQSFYDFAWNCPSQNANLNLNAQNGFAANGTLTLTNTNWNHASKTNPSNCLYLFQGDGSCSINNLFINGNNAALLTQAASFIDSVFIGGNVTISAGGILLIANNALAVSKYFLGSSVTVVDSGYIGVDNPNSKSGIVFGGGNNLYSPSSLPFFGDINFWVNGILDLNGYLLTGNGSFTIYEGGTLVVTKPGGVDSTILVTGTKIFEDGSSYIFNGTSKQVTGTMFPDTVYNLIINNDSGVVLSKNVRIAGSFELKKGTIQTVDKLLSYDTTGTLIYSGGVLQKTSDIEFPAVNGPKNLTINNSFGINLHLARIIKGDLILGGNLILGDNDFSTISNFNIFQSFNGSFVTNGSGSVILFTQSAENYFPVSNGSLSTPVQIRTSKFTDTISVRISSDTLKLKEGQGRVNLRWDIHGSTNDSGDYRIRFSWLSTHEDSIFSKNRIANAKVYSLSDTTEAGTQYFPPNLSNEPFYLSRRNIKKLGSFAIGGFKIITDVEEESDDLPTEFKLAQNYPNPFNPSTTIKYHVATTEIVTIKIFDILGREVTTLVNEQKQPGKFDVQWNASNISSGLYFYRIQAGKFVETKKMVLLK